MRYEYIQKQHDAKTCFMCLSINLKIGNSHFGLIVLPTKVSIFHADNVSLYFPYSIWQPCVGRYGIKSDLLINSKHFCLIQKNYICSNR